MSMISYHPAPGLGDLLPGFFVVPQNPIADAQGVTYVPRIGEILPGSYAVPQNPIKDYMSGRLNLIGREPGVPGKVNGVSGCGCGGSCGGCGGLGDISTDFSKFTTDITSGNFTQALQDSIVGIPVWAIGAGLALLFFAGGETHSYYGRTRRASRAARSAFA